MWYAYALYPIDHHWNFLTPLSHLASELGSDEAANSVFYDNPYASDQATVEQLKEDWKEARSLARQVGWEGDLPRPPSVFWIPGDDSFEYGFAFKQQNNGMTFIISPRALPWLAKHAAQTADSLDRG